MSPMELALAYRKKYFLIAGAVGAVSILLALVTGDSFESSNDSDVLTYGLLAFSSLSLLFFAFYTFDARRLGPRLKRVDDPDRQSPISERVGPMRISASNLLIPQGTPRSLEEVGKTLSSLASTLLVQPFMFGLVLFTITGDLWRQLLFLPVGLLAGVAYWFRIRTALEGLSNGGLA